MNSAIFNNKLAIAVVVSAVMLTGSLFAITQTGSLATNAALPHVQHASADNTPATVPTNESQTIELDGVTVSFEVTPTEVHAVDRANINVKITDTASGAPLSHVDWAIIIKDPDGKEVYKTSTSHSHMGVESFDYAFLNPGKNTVTVQMSSLGPKMLGMDVPKEALTRIFKSGDPMKSPEVDETFFFGSRSHDFVVKVGSQGGIRTITSDMGKDVEIELSTNPFMAVAGQPTTLILNVRDAATGKNIMHPDALIKIQQGAFALTDSAEAGSPMMPMSGAYHGHTGEMAVTTIFPTTGFYLVDIATNSLPVSDVQYGHASARFKVLVVEDGVASTSTPVSTAAPNQISILGQAAPYFGPQNLTVKVGSTVTVVNDDFVVHTVTSTDADPGNAQPAPNDIFDTGILANGESKQITFDKEGTYNYFCMVHPYMRGTVTVTQ
jgi:plastocyanin